jgi:hypothetical protein
MKRTMLAVALATGALAIPAVALAAGDGGSPTQEQAPYTAPVQQQEQQPQQPRGDDCPEGQGPGGQGGAPDGGSGGESGSGSGSSDTLL